MGTTGCPDHQFPVEQDLAWRKLRSSDAIEHDPECGFPDLVRRLMHRREWNGKQTRVRYIIDSHETNVFRYADLSLQKEMHELPGNPVIDAHEGLDRMNFVSSRPLKSISPRRTCLYRGIDDRP